MTKAATIYGSKTQSDALRPGPLRPANIIRNKFPTYKNGSNGIVIKLADGPEIPPLKEIVAKETADLLDRRQRLSVRELAMKFEKGLSTATLLSNEVQTRSFQCIFCQLYLNWFNNIIPIFILLWLHKHVVHFTSVLAYVSLINVFFPIIVSLAKHTTLSILFDFHKLAG